MIRRCVVCFSRDMPRAMRTFGMRTEAEEIRVQRITSLEITNCSNGLMCNEDTSIDVLKIYRAGKVRHQQFNWLSQEPDSVWAGKPMYEHIYKIQRAKLDCFFDFLATNVKVQDWQQDYSVPVCDGFSWECKIRYSDRTVKNVTGTVDAPPGGKKIMECIYALTDFEVKPWLF